VVERLITKRYLPQRKKESIIFLKKGAIEQTIALRIPISLVMRREIFRSSNKKQ
jgi:hypothetical protein